MRRRILCRKGFSAAAALAAILLPNMIVAARAADAAHPTVVELFQSQGCSSCPPANATVMAIANRADVLALSWQVTYWDYLGWKDTFAQPAFTQRQYDYAHGLHHQEVATPQVVVNGAVDVVGDDRQELESVMRKVDRGDAGPALTLTNGHAAIAGQGSHAVVVLVRYDPAIVQVPVGRGENQGRTLPHKNVVREVAELGEWNGGARSYALPAPARPGLKTAILVQDGIGGRILAAVHD